MTYNKHMHQRTWLTLLTLPLITAFTVPMFHRQAPRPMVVKQGVASVDDPLAGLADIQDVLAHISANYVDVPDLAKAIAGGIQEALERVSLLNSYILPDEALLPDPGHGETGLTLLKAGILAVVVGITPDSPAAAAGMQIGDRVRRLDGESIGALSQWAIERRLRGNIGSEATLVVMSTGSSDQKRITLKREKPLSPKVVLKADPKVATVILPDLGEGRAAELAGIFKRVDNTLPLVVDLRTCIGGSYEEAAMVASMFGCSGTFATLQESGQPDRPIPVPQAEAIRFSKIAVLVGMGTLGPAETLAVALKHLGSESQAVEKEAQTIIFLGERTIGQAVGRVRFQLKQGGAVELVARRWTGYGGERLDMGSMGGRLSMTGLTPDYSLRGISDDEKLMPRILEALEKGPIRPKDGSKDGPNVVARLGGFFTSHSEIA